MQFERLHEILEKIKRVRIAVYGDFCLDAYWFLDPKGGEISAETGLHSRAVRTHYYRLGGGSNVVANVAALAPAQVQVIGVIGNDIFGREVMRQMQEIGVDISSLFIQEQDFHTVTFSKIILENKEQPRIDFGFFNARTEKTDQLILQRLRQAMESMDALIFNQQVPGSLARDLFINGVNQLLDEFHDKIVLLDSRHYGRRFKNIVRKTNEVEAACLAGKESHVLDQIPLDETKIHARQLFAESGKPVFVTRGHHGILVVDRDGLHDAPGVKISGPLDTVGAGDTVVSALGLCLAAGVSPAEAAEFANLAAGVTVQKLFMTGTATGEEIMEVWGKAHSTF
ncbi:MAG: bifunctional heptose 7-phosphate kinase/heptose 1-phosphate adenyltransferase [Candidatus Zhuqueibacterota bacterium]